MTISLKSVLILPIFFTVVLTASLHEILQQHAAERALRLQRFREKLYGIPGLQVPGSSQAGAAAKNAQPKSNAPKVRGHKGGGKARYETKFPGKWELFLPNTGVSVMHSILLPNNKMVCYDATIWKISQIPLAPGTPCRVIDPKKNEQDCWAHSVEIDINTGFVKPLLLKTDTWCSSGALDVNGTLVGTGGDQGGTRTVRYLDTCEDCKWREHVNSLADGRWYATQVTMDNGDFAVFGGRGMYSYEFIPLEGKANKKATFFPFLRETTDVLVENNLYPFVHLSTDGNLFVFANNRSVLFNPRNNQVIREFPALEGGARNYPASGMSALMPIRLYVKNPAVIRAEVLICGGALHESFDMSQNKKIFIDGLRDCGRLQITNPRALWKKEYMPKPRVMGDMMVLPTGDILMLNGAQKGTSAWNCAQEPNFNPVLYKFKAPRAARFQELQGSNIPRMYHSSSNLLPDGRIFVAGSNTNDGYKFQGIQFATEMRAEKYSPPYLDPALDIHRPEIQVDETKNKLTYNNHFKVVFDIPEDVTLKKKDIEVTMYYPSFTTHGISMNQRLLFLGKVALVQKPNKSYEATLMAPPSGKVAPPGYYMLFVIHRGIPGKAMWVQLY